MGTTTIHSYSMGNWSDYFGDWKGPLKKYFYRILIVLAVIAVFILFPINAVKDAMKSQAPAATESTIDSRELENWLPWLNISGPACKPPPWKCPTNSVETYYQGG
jgi:hypothetical protein